MEVIPSKSFTTKASITALFRPLISSPLSKSLDLSKSSYLTLAWEFSKQMPLLEAILEANPAQILPKSCPNPAQIVNHTSHITATQIQPVNNSHKNPNLSLNQWRRWTPLFHWNREYPLWISFPIYKTQSPYFVIPNSEITHAQTLTCFLCVPIKILKINLVIPYVSLVD